MHTLPPPAHHRPPAARRRAPAGWESRSIQVGIVGTILVHLLLFWLAPKLRLRDPVANNSATAPNAPAAFEVQLAPDVVSLPPLPAPPPKFVETNPAAPDNVPDKTTNFGAQNQQVAQPVPTPGGKSDAPASKGDPDKSSTAIVSGQLTDPQPLPVAPATPPPQPPTPEATAATKPQSPLPGTAHAQGENPDSLGTSVAPTGPNPAPVANRVEGTPGATANNQFTIGLPVHIDPLHPQPRPLLTTSTVQARPTPLLNNFTGTEHTGLTAYDAKWSSYGEYLQLLINSVQVQWERILQQSAIFPEAGSRVLVVFRLNAQGEIAEIVKVGGNANHEAQTACVSAITMRSPYGAWSDDMIALLGTTQELTFEFYYY